MEYKKRKRLASIVAFGGITLALIIIFATRQSGSKSGGIIGIGVFVAACVATVIIDTKSSGRSKIASRKAGAEKYDPLLLDERTKQDPDVQRLLQYTAVQKAFFDPNFLGSAEAQSDPNIQELLAVFDRMLQSRGFSPNQGELNTSTPYAQELFRNNPSKLQKKTNKPRHVIGALLALVGMMLLITPFVLMFVFSLADAPDGTGDLSSLLFAAVPAGLVFIIVGSIVGRR